MSLDMWVYSFVDGEPVPYSDEVFEEVFGPYVDRVEPEHHYRHVTAPDGSDSDVYVGGTLMFNRFGHGQVMDLVVEFARRTNGVVVVPGSPVCLVDAGQRAHLPEGLADEFDTVVVRDGHGVVAAMR